MGRVHADGDMLGAGRFSLRNRLLGLEVRPLVLFFLAERFSSLIASDIELRRSRRRANGLRVAGDRLQKCVSRPVSDFAKLVAKRSGVE